MKYDQGIPDGGHACVFQQVFNKCGKSHEQTDRKDNGEDDRHAHDDFVNSFFIEGGEADLIFLDLREPSLFPHHNIVSSLCYSANGSEVDSVMIGGEFVMRKRELLTIDLEKVYFEIDKIKI